MKPCKIIIRQPKYGPRQRNIHNVITFEGPSGRGSLDLSPLPYPRQGPYSYGVIQHWERNTQQGHPTLQDFNEQHFNRKTTRKSVTPSLPSSNNRPCSSGPILLVHTSARTCRENWLWTPSFSKIWEPEREGDLNIQGASACTTSHRLVKNS